MKPIGIMTGLLKRRRLTRRFRNLDRESSLSGFNPYSFRIVIICGRWPPTHHIHGRSRILCRGQISKYQGKVISISLKAEFRIRTVNNFFVILAVVGRARRWNSCIRIVRHLLISGGVHVCCIEASQLRPVVDHKIRNALYERRILMQMSSYEAGRTSWYTKEMILGPTLAPLSADSASEVVYTSHSISESIALFLARFL